MRKLYLFLLAGAAASAVISGSATGQISTSSQPSTIPIGVPRGVVVPVLVTKAIRVGGGAAASTGVTKVEFAVAQDVILNGDVILRAGDPVEGHYTSQRNITTREFSTETSQELTLDLDDAINFCGDTVHLAFERTFVGGARGGFMSFGIHAHDAVFDKGLILKASVDRFEKTVCAEQTSETEASLPANIVLPDDEVSPGP